MRFATFVFRHPDGSFQSLGAAFADADDVTRVAVHSQQLLDDGQAIYLYELEGDDQTVRQVLEDSEITTKYTVIENGDSTFAYIHFEPNPTVKRLLQAPATLGLMIDSPITVKDNGRIEITLIGEETDIQRALTTTPDELVLDIKRMGDYAPGAQRLFTTLSTRQQEVLRRAYELGYYQQPRDTTYKEIAEEFDCTPANVGEILRRIENSIMDQILTSRFDARSESPA